MILAVDIDGTIADTTEEMCRRYEAIGYEADPEKLITFKWEDSFGAPHENWIRDNLADPTFWLNLKPYPDAWLYLNRWRDEDHEIHLVTARWERDITERWLGEWDIPYDSLTCNIKTGFKYKTCKKLNADIMIEDRPEEILALSQKEVVTFVPSRTWNKDIMDDQFVFTVSSFADIDSIIFDR